MDDFDILSYSKSVLANSNFRISFEPKKEIEKEFRERLRFEIAKLKLSNNQILFVTFKNKGNDFFDVENILFYNIGTSMFRDISSNGIIFEYPDETLQSKQWCNLYEYRIINKIDYCSYFTDKRVCEFEFEINKINTEMKPHNYWYAFHKGKVDSCYHANEEAHYFGIDLQIHTPQSFHNIASFIKPMLDGIISALHYELNFDEIGAEKLGHLLDLKSDEISELLRKKPYSILGSRNILSSYRSGIKWNPQDEKCRKVRIVPVVNTEYNKVAIKGKINWLYPK